MKRKVVCSTCGSDDIQLDAYARWDFDKQEWYLSDTYEDAYCGNCCETANIEYVEVK